MNAHLNIYKTYTKQSREGYQLEDDLTRALAIALQENDVFSHQFLSYILNHKENTYKNLFDNFNEKPLIEIDIQKSIKGIKDFDHLFAVRISGEAMGDDFFEQSHKREYSPITDLYIRIDKTVIIFEVKPKNDNSTAQLYNQAYNAFEDEADKMDAMKSKVTPVDFNWPLLMQLAVRVNNYQVAIAKPSRLLDNFISYIKMHNYQWLPQLALSSLTYGLESGSIIKRISDTIESSENLSINNRLGFKYNFGWAEEVHLSLNENSEQICFTVYPGNTKSQGKSVFKDEGEPEFKKEVIINGKPRELKKGYHVKFSGQSFITGLWASEDNFREPLYTLENFYKFSGRKKRDIHWKEIESLFDRSFKTDYGWREKCNWESKISRSNRSQFDLSFGYEISFCIPYKELQQLDTDRDNLQPLIQLLEEVKNAFMTIMLIELRPKVKV